MKAKAFAQSLLFWVVIFGVGLIASAIQYS